MRKINGISVGFNKGIDYGQKAFCFAAVGLKLIYLVCRMVAVSLTSTMYDRVEITAYTIMSLFVDMGLVVLVACCGGVPLSFMTTEIPLGSLCHTYAEKFRAYAVLVLTVVAFLLIAGFISVGGYGVHSVGEFAVWLVVKVVVTVVLVVSLFRKYDAILDSYFH